MRLGVVVVAVLAIAFQARADELAKYAGQIVISPDPVPLSATELGKWLADNVTKDGHYELIKTWDIHLAAVLAKDPGHRQITLVVFEKVDAPAKASKAKPSAPEPLISIELTAKRKLVAAHATATAAAGFVADKPYAVQILLDHAVLASAELTLRH